MLAVGAEVTIISDSSSVVVTINSETIISRLPEVQLVVVVVAEEGILVVVHLRICLVRHLLPDQLQIHPVTVQMLALGVEDTVVEVQVEAEVMAVKGEVEAVEVMEVATVMLVAAEAMEVVHRRREGHRRLHPLLEATGVPPTVEEHPMEAAVAHKRDLIHHRHPQTIHHQQSLREGRDPMVLVVVLAHDLMEVVAKAAVTDAKAASLKMARSWGASSQRLNV